MSIPRPYLTFVINVALGLIASIIAYFTDWLILIPVLFALGIPLINIDKPLKQKLGITLVITISTLFIFVGAVIASLNIDYHNYLLQGIVVGIAGVMVLLTNGYLIDSVTINTKTVLLTFILSGLSFPLWILTEHLLPNSIASIDIIPEFGNMMFWIAFTTVGIAVGIREHRSQPHPRA